MPTGCWVLARHDHSCPLAGSGCPMVQQHPRYVAAKRNMPVHFICYSQDPHSMQWYKMTEDSDELYELGHSTSRYSIERKDKFINFTIFRITYEDNGIYVCDSKNLTAEKKQPHLCGTELRVMGEWELPMLHAPQEMLFLLLSPFPPPYEPHLMLLCTSHTGGTPSDTTADALWPHRDFSAHCQPPSSRAAFPGLPWHIYPAETHPRDCIPLINPIFPGPG